MAIERTLSIIKPDAVAKNVIGEILSRFEKADLRIVAARMAHLSQEEAEGFYAVHKERPFFNDLVSFMTSGPVMIQVLEGEGAIAFHPQARRSAALVVLRAPDVPAVLFESGFVTNEEDVARLTTPEGQREYARVLAQAIRIYFARRLEE